jgi:hypothetical protein
MNKVVTYSDGKADLLMSGSAKFGRRRSTVGCPVQPIVYKFGRRLRYHGAGCVMWCGMLPYWLIEFLLYVTRVVTTSL